MHSTWELIVLALALFMSSRAATTTGPQGSEPSAAWSFDNSSAVTPSGAVTPSRAVTPSGAVTSSSDNTTLVEETTGVNSPAIFNAGVLTYAEYARMREVQGWIYLCMQPLAVLLLILSAVAFLKDAQFSSNVYLAAVCLSEAWSMSVLFSHYACKLKTECFASQLYVQVSIWSVSYTGMAARRCGYILSALLTVQRFLAIAFPLKVRSIRIIRRPMFPLVFVVLVCLLLHLYRPLRHTAVPIDDGGGIRWTQGYSSLYIQYRQTFMTFAEVAKYVCTYVPMLVCLIFNCLLLSTLAKHNKGLNNLDSSHSNGTARCKVERQMTVTILGSTLLMLVFNTPVNINEAVPTYHNDYGILKREHYLYMVLRSCFVLLSNVCDIVVVMSYLLLSANFRRRFLALLSPPSCPTHRQTRSARRSAGSAGNPVTGIRVNSACLEMISVKIEPNPKF